MTKENNKKCKWIAPNGQQYDCKPSPVCGDCENNTFSENRQYRIVGSSYADIAEKRIAELEAQIKKMKCCFNCKHSRTEYEHCKTDKHEKWELKEND